MLLNEFLTYLIKYIILLLVAVAGACCGARYKKSKIAKTQSESNNASATSNQKK